MRILIAEDSGIVREGLRRLLQDAGHEVVAAVSDEPGVHAALLALEPPDVAILDMRMPPTHTDEGARAAAALRCAHPRIGLLLLSQHVDARSAARLMQEHPQGFGYLLKDRVVDVDELLEAVQRVAAGGFVVDPEVVSQALAAAGRRSVLDRLTRREREILELVSRGRSNQAIATRLGLSGKTVEHHVSNVFLKLGLDDDADEHRRIRAVLLYLQHGGGDGVDKGPQGEDGGPAR